MAERIDNALENLWFSAGWDLASDTEAYRKWRTTELISEVSDAVFGNGLIGKLANVFTNISKDIQSIASVWEPLTEFLDNAGSILDVNA